MNLEAESLGSTLPFATYLLGTCCAQTSCVALGS